MKKIMDPQVFLDYAAVLATLTYVLGGLIYMLPIPVYGVKKWGPAMIKDGIYATVWIAIYQIVLNFANSLLGLLGASWGFYIAYLETNLAVLGGVYVVLAGIIAGARVVGGLDIPVISGIGNAAANFQPLQAAVSGLGEIFELYLALYVFSVLIEFVTPFLVAIGVMLMSLPFRIGRGIGATLIAFSLTFYVGLPLLPVFTNLVLQSIFSSIQPIDTSYFLIIPIQLAISPTDAIQTIVQFFQTLANNIFVITQVGNPITLILISEVIVPILYITILTGITFGLARAIGERAGDIPIIAYIF